MEDTRRPRFDSEQSYCPIFGITVIEQFKDFPPPVIGSNSLCRNNDWCKGPGSFISGRLNVSSVALRILITHSLESLDEHGPFSVRSSARCSSHLINERLKLTTPTSSSCNLSLSLVDLELESPDAVLTLEITHCRHWLPLLCRDRARSLKMTLDRAQDGVCIRVPYIWRTPPQWHRPYKMYGTLMVFPMGSGGHFRPSWMRGWRRMGRMSPPMTHIMGFLGPSHWYSMDGTIRRVRNKKMHDKSDWPPNLRPTVSGWGLTAFSIWVNRSVTLRDELASGGQTVVPAEPVSHRIQNRNLEYYWPRRRLEWGHILEEEYWVHDPYSRRPTSTGHWDKILVFGG